jgi:serine/threonine protein kinase
VRASELCRTPPPIGHSSNTFRSCLIPGKSFARLTPFGGEPPENNISKAEKLPLVTAAGLWRLAEETLAQLLALHDGGLAHGDTELHNIIVSPAPLEPILIDFEAAARQDAMAAADWEKRCKLDLEPLLREAVYLQCALGRQPSRLGELSWDRLPELFRSPDRFQHAIEMQAGL